MKNDLWISLSVMMLLVSIFVLVEMRPDLETDNRQYAVIFPTDRSDMENMTSIHQAGGRMIRDGLWQNIKLISAKDKNFEQNIYKAGALFVFKPFVRGGCITEDQTRFEVAQK